MAHTSCSKCCLCAASVTLTKLCPQLGCTSSGGRRRCPQRVRSRAFYKASWLDCIVQRESRRLTKKPRISQLGHDVPQPEIKILHRETSGVKQKGIIGPLSAAQTLLGTAMSLPLSTLVDFRSAVLVSGRRTWTGCQLPLTRSLYGLHEGYDHGTTVKQD